MYKRNKLLQFNLNPLPHSPPTIITYLLLPNFGISVASSPLWTETLPGSAFSILHSVYTLSTLFFHENVIPSPTFNYHSYFEACFPLQVYFSNSDFSARHLTLISIIWYLHPKHHLSPTPNMFPLYSCNCYGLEILGSKLFFPSIWIG